MTEGQPEFNYPRIDSAIWGTHLDAAASASGGSVVLPISWARHEIAPGRFDFSSGSLGLRRLLDLAGTRGVGVCLRLGGNAVDRVDLPDRLRGRRSLFAQDPRGALVRVPGDATRFVPSAAATVALRERGEFLMAVGAVVAEAVAGGLNVAVDCGGALRGFAALGPFDADYHPSSRALFWTFLEERYGDIRELNDEYGTSHASFSAVELPTTFAPSAPGDLPAHFDWAAYQEFYRLWGAVKLKEAFASSLGRAAANVRWTCVLPRSGVPFSVDESSRFFEDVAVQGAASPAAESTAGPRVMFCMPREYARLEWLAASVVVSAAPPMTWAAYGFLDDVPAAAKQARELWRGAVAGGFGELIDAELSVAGVGRQAPAFCVVPTFDFISVATWRAVAEIAGEGGVVVVGPRMPWLSAALKPFGEIRSVLKQCVESNDMFEKYRVGRGAICVMKSEAVPDDARRELIRRVVRALAPGKSGRNGEVASV